MIKITDEKNTIEEIIKELEIGLESDERTCFEDAIKKLIENLKK